MRITVDDLLDLEPRWLELVTRTLSGTLPVFEGATDVVVGYVDPARRLYIDLKGEPVLKLEPSPASLQGGRAPQPGPDRSSSGAPRVRGRAPRVPPGKAERPAPES